MIRCLVSRRCFLAYPNLHNLLKILSLPSALQNIKGLRSFVEEQKMAYDMGYYSLDFETDCPVVVLSSSKSIISTCLCEVPVASPIPTTNDMVDPQELAPILEAVRFYLAAVRWLKVEVTEEVQRRAEDDFVRSRAQEGRETTLEEFSRYRWYKRPKIHHYFIAREVANHLAISRTWGGFAS